MRGEAAMNNNTTGNSPQYSIIKATNYAFLLKVECRGCVYYEVMKNLKPIDLEHKKPDWSSYNYKFALRKFKQLNKGGRSHD
jgi:hypothetical protein